MKNCLLVSVAALAAFVHAGHDLKAEVAVGVARNAAMGSISEEKVTAAHAYTVPTVQIGVARPVSGALGGAAKVKGDWAALSEGQSSDVTLKPSYAVNASVGMTYKSGMSELYAGPSLNYTQVTFAANEFADAKQFDGFGAVVSVSHKVHDLFGVRLTAQHSINKTVSSWDDQLEGRIGSLTSNVSQLGVALYTDINYSDLNL